MFRKLERYGLLLALAVLCGGGAVQGQTVLTRHVREAVKNGNAKLVGQMPTNQMMRLVIVLPLRNQNALDQFLRMSTIRPVLRIGTSSRWINSRRSSVPRRAITTP